MVIIINLTKTGKNIIKVLMKNFLNNLIEKHFNILEKNYAELQAHFANSLDYSSLFKQNKQLVTEGEKLFEAAITADIKKEYPNIRIYGEEHGDSGNKSETTIYIDPIDGTAAYIQSAMVHANKQPSFGICIGVKEGDKFTTGIVRELKNINDKLTLLPQEEINLTPQPKRKPKLACTAPAAMFQKPIHQTVFANFAAECEVITDQNCMGYIQLCRGEVDIALEQDLDITDVAAIIPILQANHVHFYASEIKENTPIQILAARKGMADWALEKLENPDDSVKVKQEYFQSICENLITAKYQ